MKTLQTLSLLLILYSTSLIGIAQADTANTTTTDARSLSLMDQRDGRFGVGLMLGEPSGITGKYWLSEKTAIDVSMAYSFNDYYAILADYLIHFPNAFNTTMQGDLKGQFIPFVGFGAILFINSSNSNSFGAVPNQHFFTDSNGNTAALGLRVPIGIEFLTRSAPLGFYGEIDPGVGIIPDTFGFVEAEIGARFYF